MRTPMWAKYPKEMELSEAVTTNSMGYNQDDRMTGILDLYPTILSVIGYPKDKYMTGRAMAGIFEKKGERSMMFAIGVRLNSLIGWKSFAAFNKEYYYQRHLLNADAIEEYRNSDEYNEDTYEIAVRNSQYVSRYGLFAASPLFNHMRKLLVENAENDSY